MKIGPYRSKWSSKDYYIVSDLIDGEIVYVVVIDGQQRSEGVRHLTLADAKASMKSNGFELGDHCGK